MKRFATAALVASGMLAGMVTASQAGTVTYEEATLVGVQGNSIVSRFGGLAAQGNGIAFDAGLLTDDNLSTGVRVTGLESNPAWGGADFTVDGGAWLLLEFELAHAPNSFYLDIQGRAFSESGDIHNNKYFMMDAVGNFGSNHRVRAAWDDETIQTIAGTFTESGNDFNVATRQSMTISDIALANNRFQFLFFGPYLQGLHDEGAQGIEIFEAKLTVGVAPVPLPAALPLLMSALGFFGFMGWRRKKADAKYAISGRPE